MQFKPHNYQAKALKHILDTPRCALWLDMGLGKTVVTLTALRELMARGEVGRALVVAPLRVARTVWAQEAAKWDHLRGLHVARVLGTPAQRRAALREPADIWVINIDNLPWLVDLVGKDWPFDAVVLDEFSLWKSHSTKRFKALKKVTPYPDTVIGLTGTPAPNSLMDLWSQLFLLDHGARLGKFVTHFKARYFEHDYMKFHWWPRPGAASEIQRLVRDLCLSMTSKDYLQLPDRINNTIRVQLPDEAMAAYRVLEREMYLDLDQGGIEAANAAALTTKCLQYANGAVYTEDNPGGEEVHQAKLDALGSVLEEAAGKPVLCFYSFLSDVSRIKARFKQAVVLDKAGAVIEQWNAGKVPLLLAHPASAGHGLNLQEGGHIIVWFGLTWSLEHYLQANARLDRQGQAHPVVVHHLVAEGTVDELVMKRLETKRDVQDVLIEAMKRREAA